MYLIVARLVPMRLMLVPVVDDLVLVYLVYRLAELEYLKKVKRRKSRRLWKIDLKICTCSISPCQPVNEWCLCMFFFFAKYSVVYFVVYLVLKPPQILVGKKKQKNIRRLTGRQGLAEYVCRNSISISQNRREHLGFCAENM